MHWQSNFDINADYWQDYRQFITALPERKFPCPQSLNRLVPDNLRTASGQPVRFVKSTELADEDYEKLIFSKGLVSTRPNSWHDLFNAMVWLRFPRIKAAINKQHNQAKPEVGKRGQLRDTLTLFDECGVILISSQVGFLESAASRDWNRVFLTEASRWKHTAKIAICGHAMLEKLINPYKSMTAKALLVQVSTTAMGLPQNELLTRVDQEVAKLMLSNAMLNTTSDLSPLPLAGIPDWDFAGSQNEQFYADANVFRPAPDNLKPAPIFKLHF